MVAVAQPARLARTVSAKRMVALVRSEFTKVRTVRSTYLTLIALVVVTVGLSCLLSWATAANWAKESASSRASFDPTATSLTGFILGQVFIAAFGVLALTTEYSTGMISATLTAQPRRIDVYAAKALVVDRGGGRHGRDSGIYFILRLPGHTGQHSCQREDRRSRRASIRDRLRPVPRGLRAVLSARGALCGVPPAPSLPP